MADSFVPLYVASEKNRDTTFFSIHDQPPSPAKAAMPVGSSNTSFIRKAPTAAAETSPSLSSSHAEPVCASKPVVTLQRTGDNVTSIHIKCGCGQVIELACDY